MRSGFVRILALAALLAVMPIAVAAQEVTLSGLITDSTGAVLGPLAGSWSLARCGEPKAHQAATQWLERGSSWGVILSPLAAPRRLLARAIASAAAGLASMDVHDVDPVAVRRSLPASLRGGAA